MEPLKPTFKCPIQDLPPIGEFLLSSVKRDIDVLRSFSIKYKGDTFINGYQAALDEVNALVNPATFTAQHKLLTAEMEADAIAIRPLLNHLDVRLSDAADLGRQTPLGPQLIVAPADFGIKALRTAITAHDAEGIAAHGKDVIQRLIASADILTVVEYPTDERIEMKRLLDRLARNNVAQNELISARNANVQENLHILNAFYDNFVARASSDGKKVFKETDVAKTNDYTFARLKARVAAQRPVKPRKGAPKA